MQHTYSLLIVLSILFAFPAYSLAGNTTSMGFDAFNTDIPRDDIVYFFDLRERETFIQVTYSIDSDEGGGEEDVFVAGQNLRAHVQIFDVSRDCVENNFFDEYTPNDTHVYNMRDIQTNDGNPSGVVLPQDAFGFVFVNATDDDGSFNDNAEVFIGNLRILDNNGYEYRTNAVGEPTTGTSPCCPNDQSGGYINFNTSGDITLSDIVGLAYNGADGGDEVNASEIQNYVAMNVDIFDENENIFSCRDVIYACRSADSPLMEALLELAAEETPLSANVARSEYGINNAIPHSKGGELLCPGNNIEEGFVRLQIPFKDATDADDVAIWVGLNNGNGRGSMDTIWYSNDTVNNQ